MSFFHYYQYQTVYDVKDGKFKDLSDVFKEISGRGGDDPVSSTINDDGGTTYVFDIPGVKKQDIEITVHETETTAGAILRLRWKRDKREKTTDVLILPHLDVSRHEARLEDGVLYVKFGRREHASVRQIKLT